MNRKHGPIAPYITCYSYKGNNCKYTLKINNNFRSAFMYAMEGRHLVLLISNTVLDLI